MSKTVLPARFDKSEVLSRTLLAISKPASVAEEAAFRVAVAAPAAKSRVEFDRGTRQFGRTVLHFHYTRADLVP